MFFKICKNGAYNMDEFKIRNVLANYIIISAVVVTPLLMVHLMIDGIHKEYLLIF